jgi:zinc-finger binding domain of transposase IS66
VKPKATRRRGRQPGVSGAGLAMAETPDPVEDHRPSVCGDCGETLSGAAPQGFTRRQVADIPLVTVQITEHRLHKVRCDCGQVTTAPARAGRRFPHLIYQCRIRQRMPLHELGGMPCCQIEAVGSSAHVDLGPAR